MAVSVDEIAQVLASFGCPEDRCVEMAKQLDKRAQQLSATKGRTYEEAIAHLLRLMAGGWAAQASDSGEDPAGPELSERSI